LLTFTNYSNTAPESSFLSLRFLSLPARQRRFHNGPDPVKTTDCTLKINKLHHSTAGDPAGQIGQGIPQFTAFSS
jgi:hypothetical protein